MKPLTLSEIHDADPDFAWGHLSIQVIAREGDALHVLPGKASRGYHTGMAVTVVLLIAIGIFAIQDGHTPILLAPAAGVLIAHCLSTLSLQYRFEGVRLEVRPGACDLYWGERRVALQPVSEIIVINRTVSRQGHDIVDGVSELFVVVKSGKLEIAYPLACNSTRGRLNALAKQIAEAAGCLAIQFVVGKNKKTLRTTLGPAGSIWCLS